MSRNPAARPNTARIATETAQVFDLKLKGNSIRQIAALTGLAKSTVQNRLDDAISDLVTPLAEESRKIDVTRLDSYLRVLEERLADGEDPVRVVPVMLQVLTRRAKLLGLDEPIRQHVEILSTDLVQAAIDQLIAEEAADEALNTARANGGGLE